MIFYTIYKPRLSEPSAVISRYRKEKVMLKIGCHLSCAKGFLAMGKDAVKIGANTFQFFTRNPRGGKAKELDQEDISAFLSFWEKEGGYPLLAHAPYTLSRRRKHSGICQKHYGR